MSLSYIVRILYDAGGHTGVSYYVRFVRKADGYIYDAVNKVAAANPDWEDSAIDLVETGTTGQFPIVCPEDLPRGNWDYIVYIKAGSTPQNTDNVEYQNDFSAGSIFGF